MEKIQPSKKRPALQSILFIINECLSSFESLKEMNRLHKQMLLMKSEQRDLFPIRSELIPHILGTVRDHLCIRVRNLFDKRTDSYSLKDFYPQLAIDKLKKETVIGSLLKPANKNIAHLDKKYTPWPEVEDLIKSNLQEILETIRISIWLTK